MTAADRWQRVRTLFEAALEQDRATVNTWLEREAAGDREVLDEVRSLLQHHTQVGEFLSTPVAGRVAHLFADDNTFEAGETVGQYTIVREIGRGGMGRVYLAKDAKLGRTVALKALPPTLTRDSAQRERLRREAQAAAVLTHPGICTIYALEEIDQHVFIAAEFVEGESLRAEIERRDRPSPALVMKTAVELSDALASAHARRITHRDLKPENVMRGRDGRLKILDFGLALFDADVEGVETRPRITRPDTLIGTPGYMSPEQLNGKPADPRSDIFALGVTLYEYTSGVHPFEGNTLIALAARVLEKEPTPLATLRPDLAPVLVAVIERSLMKLPASRFQSAGEIGPALSAPLPLPRPHGVTAWWRNHQMAILGLYFVAAAAAWLLKEWMDGFADTAFLVTSVLATVAGVFRGHLLFTERMNRPSFEAELRRALPVTLVVDLSIAIVMAVDGWGLASSRPLAGVLTVSLGLTIALTRILIEPATTRGAFES